MQAPPGRVVPSDYQDALARDPALAPPTCCCCCCCCCSLVLPEAMVASSWANKTLERYAQVNLRPPLATVLKAFAGGVVAGNLTFWVLALIIGFALVAATVGVALVIIPVVLAVTLTATGAAAGRRGALAAGLSPGEGAGLGAVVGFGMAILTVGSIVGVGTIVAFVFMAAEGENLLEIARAGWPMAGLACLGGSIAILVQGAHARSRIPAGPWAPPQRPPPGRDLL